MVEVIPGHRNQLKLSSVPTGDLTGADVIITSGAAAGTTAPLGRVASDGKGQVGLVFEPVGDTIDIMADPTVVDSIEAGDEVRIDNSRFLALQTYHRHQFPPANPDFDYPDVYDYFRNPDGTPKYPQRGVDIGAAGTLGATGQIPTGRFNGKMIVVECLHDGDALPWQADWYRKKVEAVEGPHVDEKYRLWYVDNANHTDPTTERQQTHAVAYSGTVQYALRELSAWVEHGIVPPPTSEYRVQDGQVHVPASAAERKGDPTRGPSRGERRRARRGRRWAKPSPSPHRSRCRPPRAKWCRRSGTSRAWARIRTPLSSMTRPRRASTRPRHTPSPNRAPTSRRYASPPNVRGIPAPHSPDR